MSAEIECVTFSRGVVDRMTAQHSTTGGKGVPVSRKLPLGEGERSRTACARGLLRAGVVEKTGEVLSAAALAERVDWAAALVSSMATELLAAHWNATDVGVLASGVDAGGRALPANAWMALRRLGWSVAPPEGLRVNDRIVRIAQESAGRILRSAAWRADVTAGILATWPADPAKRTREEWDAVRDAVPGGEHLPSSVIKSRTRQVAAFQRRHGRLPVDLFEVETEPRPSHPQGRAGQRPEGHAHTDRRRLPRAAHRHQGVNTLVKHTHQPHRPRGAALGAGFYLHAHASPPRWAEPTPDATSCMGLLN
ncbi:hypothetical protein [Streptomyces cyaneus]|uniref:hypothetical protein n=1 Tax=Streptomyces cyaneus TaxID=1904 RepID=UPI001FEC7745|nr:hypothetical protein [Streptomyces cyaneus]